MIDRFMPAPTQSGGSYGLLCGELLSAVALRVTQHLTVRPYWLPADMPDPGAPGSKGALFFHEFDSAYRCAVAALASFEVATPVGGGIHALTMDANDMPGFLSKTEADGDGRLPLLLETFIRVNCGLDGLSDRRTSFMPPQHLLAALSTLTWAGYANRDGDKFCWTSRIKAAMQAAHRWGVGEQETEAEASLAWRTMPARLKEALLSGKLDQIELNIYLASNWWDGEWRTASGNAPVWPDRSVMPLAERLLEMAFEKK